MRLLSLETALISMRATNPDLKGLAPDGTDISWVSESSQDAPMAPQPKSVISLRIRGSESNAGVPFEVDEMLTLNSSASPLTIAETIVNALNGRSWFSSAVVITRHTFQGMEVRSNTAGKTEIALSWSGYVSWRPNAAS